MKPLYPFVLLFCLCLPLFSSAADNSQLFEDAMQGNREAQYTLAHLYLKGRGGLIQDSDLAVEWFKRAAALQHQDAAFDLAVIYLEGRFVPENLEDAVDWLEKAADNGHAEAQYMLGRLHAKLDVGKSIFRLQQAAAQHHEAAVIELARACHDHPLQCDEECFSPGGLFCQWPR